MADTYYTIDHTGEGRLNEKMSRFLAFAHHVETAEEAKEMVKRYQNEYHDSRHVCWAYMLGPDRKEWQLNDNGEPSGTAGKPILGQINSRQLTDVIVLVVRYFGGIKLGTSGLISAYKESASLALDDAGIKECHDMKPLSFQFDYESMDGIMRIVKGENLEVTEKIFDNICEMHLSIRSDELERIKNLISDRGGRIFC